MKWLPNFLRYISQDLRAGRMPPGLLRDHDLNGYQSDFVETAEAFRYFLRRCGVSPRSASARPVGLVVMPWVGTPMPWYIVALALGLLRLNRQPVIIWDDTPYPQQSQFLQLQNNHIGRVLGQLAGHQINVVRLSQVAAAPGRPDDDAQVATLTELNRVWAYRATPLAPKHEAYCLSARASLARTLPLVRHALAGRDLEYLVVPGGVTFSSGLFMQEARALGLRTATVDSDFGVAQVSTDGVAAQNSDLPRAFAALLDAPAAVRERAVRTAQAEFELRAEARDTYGFQVRGAQAAAGGGHSVLIPLNIEWDSAALGRHHIFKDSADWITATVDFLLNHQAGPIIVRQHPAERRKFQRSQLPIRAILEERFGQPAGLQFVGAEDDVNSYELLRSARLVLPFVSTIGIEAAALGKPVVTAGRSYYSDLGFAHTARTSAEYFNLLEAGLSGSLAAGPDQQQRAWLCYYLVAVCNRLKTKFTPHPSDFWHWCRRRPDVLYRDSAVRDVLTAMDENIPLALLGHNRLTSTSKVREPGNARTAAL